MMKRMLNLVILPMVVVLGLMVLFATQPTFGTETGRGEAVAEATTVTMVAVPSEDAQSTARAAERVAALLEQEIGYEVYAFVSACYGAAVEAMAVGEADVGWLPTVTYVLANDEFGVDVKLTVERSGFSSYRSQFLVRNDSGITDLAGLAGKNFAFVDPLSGSGFMFPAVHISNTQGITYGTFFSETLFAGSHNDSVRAVYYGEHEGTPIDGGAMYEDARWAVSGEIPDIFTETQVIDYAGPIPNDTVSVRPGLDAIVSQEVISGLLTLAGTPEGQQALQDLYRIDGLIPGDDSDYDIVRQMVTMFGLTLESCSEAADVTNEMGGWLSYVDAGGLTTTLEIPEGAVTGTLQLSYAPIPAITYPPGGLRETGHSFDLRAVVSGTLQTVVYLQAPYTITVEYDDGQVGAVGEGSLALYYWDGGAWVVEPSSAVDGDSNRVVATPDHFSQWAVLGTPKVFLPMVLRGG